MPLRRIGFLAAARGRTGQVTLIGTLLLACASNEAPGGATNASTSSTSAGDGGGGATGVGGATGDGGATGVGGASVGGGGSGNSGGGTCCDCTGFACTATLDCFCATYSCTPMPGADGPFAGSVTFEYADCDRTLYYSFIENEAIAHLVQTSTGTVVGARYTEDAGVCGVADAQIVHAGEPFQVAGDVPGCTLSGCQATGGGTCP